LAINGYTNGARLIPRDEVLNDIWHPLSGIAAPEYIPPTWTDFHAGKRLSEAFEVLARMPHIRGPRDYENSWPREILVEWEDAIARAQQEQAERDRADKQQNRVRVLPTSNEISRMEAALSWPARYLSELPQLLRTVGACALVRSRGRDQESAARRLGIPGRLVRRWNGEGLKMISGGLVRDQVRVF
jgi:hypothetical protein